MTKPAHERPSIAAAVIVRDGLVLLVRRKTAEGQLSWQFPAGEVEPGETGEEAAARETAEETGITVAPTQHLGSRIHPITGRNMIYVACEATSGEAHVGDPQDLAAVEWCDQATLAKYIPHPFFAPVQEYLETKIR